MIYEFALEPDLVALWHDRKEYLFFDEKFGMRSRRIVSAYPKKWKKLVWESFNNGPAAGDQNAQMRMTELLQFLWQNAVRRPSTFPEIAVWLERAEAEHSARPLHAILATKNPREQAFVITTNALIEKGHTLWNIPDISPTPRNAYEIAKAVSPLMRLSRHAILIDPFFDPNKKRFRTTLKAILSTCNESLCGKASVQIELHTSIDRFFQNWEKGKKRDPSEETRVFENIATDFRKRLPHLIPEGINLKMVIWKQRENGEKLHNRYLLTDLLGVMLGTGSDEAENPSAKESDDIVLLEEGQYSTRYGQYSENSSAFDQVGQPFFLVHDGA